MNKQQGEHIALGEIFINYPHSDEIKRPCSHLLLNIALIFPLRGIISLEPVEMLYYDLSICMSIRLSIYMPRSICLSVCPFSYLFVCLSYISLFSAFLAVCLSVCLSVSISSEG